MKTILLVEDEQLLSEMYKEKLEKAGFRVVTAESSEEGYRQAKKENPDIVLLDIILHDENALSFLWKKQDDPTIKAIPVIAFTNYNDPEIREEAMKLGTKEYLVKTEYTPQQIVEKLQAYVAEQENSGR